MDLLEAIDSRISARGFTDKPVASKVVHQILDHARHAPSGSNMQPWRVYAVSGEQRTEVIEASLRYAEQHPIGSQPTELQWSARALVQPYKQRRFDVGMALYDALGIERRDKERRNQQLLQNFYFFGAPVGLFFTLHRSMLPAQIGDLGILMANVMLVARAFDLHTCAQGFWQDVAPAVHQVLDIPDEYFLFNGMALGYLDPEHPANGVVSGRAEVEDFCEFHGFTDGDSSRS